MKVVGTIVEYNPLHNGHVYAIKKIKEESKADLLVAVMSSDFTMRGELSMFDKFEKTKQALQIGIDLIISLPFCYTVHNADVFAKYAISLLQLAGVSELWFGSESNDEKKIIAAYHSWLCEENQNKIKEKMKEGFSYKAATSSVIDLPSNDLLGFCYYKAIQEQKAYISIHTIQRQGSQYFDLEPDQYASAMAIRKNPSLIHDYCPSFLKTECIRNQENLFNYLKYHILQSSITELKKIFLVEEGIENVLKSIGEYTSLYEYVLRLSTKRYTNSRIQRILCYIFFGISKDDMKQILEEKASFLRVLGYTSKGKKFLNEKKKDIKIYTNIKDSLHPILDIELKITKILDHVFLQQNIKKEMSGPIFMD